MKRFKWRLQRVLEVKRRREEAQRAALFSLSRRIVRLRRVLVERQTALRAALEELGGITPAERLARQQLLMRCAAVSEDEINRLRQALRQLGDERSEKTSELIKTRNARESLERMRERARNEHVREEGRREQRELDESAHVAFSQKMPDRWQGGSDLRSLR